jgi:hypothetical protein
MPTLQQQIAEKFLSKLTASGPGCTGATICRRTRAPGWCLAYRLMHRTAGEEAYVQIQSLSARETMSGDMVSTERR